MDYILRMLMGRWTTYIVWVLCADGPTRFGELKRRVAGISAKMLTERLRTLEGAGLIKRDTRDHPAAVPMPHPPRGGVRRGAGGAGRGGDPLAGRGSRRAERRRARWPRLPHRVGSHSVTPMAQGFRRSRLLSPTPLQVLAYPRLTRHVEMALHEGEVHERLRVGVARDLALRLPELDLLVDVADIEPAHRIDVGQAFRHQLR